MQIKPRQRFRRTAQQRGGVLRHAIDHALLAVAQGVALGVGLVAEVVLDRAACRRMTGGQVRCLGEEAAQRRPA